MTVSPKLHFDGDVHFTRRTLPARAVRFAVDRLLSMDEARTRIFGADVALRLASDVGCGDRCSHEVAPYPADNDGNH